MKPPHTRRRTLLRQSLQLACGLATLTMGRSQAQAGAGGEALTIVLAPFLSPAALLSAYRPLREHLQQALGQPVAMLTAKDFRTLVDETRRQEHRVVQLPAHLARLAMLDWGWQMLAAPAVQITVVVGVKQTGPVQTAQDLRGRSVGMLDALSLTATAGRRWLELQGVAADVKIVAMPSVNSALFALDRDEIAAFVAADTQLLMLPDTTPRGDRVLARIGDIPGPVFLASPDMPAAERERLRQAMGSFTPDPSRPPGAPNSVMAPLPESRMKLLDGYAAIARQALATR
ncbi:MAG: PhnD/SsuA/transferrin family substrate-binding protein [Rubrivivax sp.]|nr:PhnD/SsuA/transferrin family substrate-binding protein [Rubrivivax sp.]MDP3222880.1 PhnD/SsuA/transferrin family substrate-binding protein [Rubrivivax sp.]